MRILIDARFYGVENAGPGRYTKSLIDNLTKIDRANNYIILLRKKHFNQIKLGNNFKKVMADYKHYTFEEQIKLPSLIKKHNPDLVHFPFFNVPVFYSKPFVVTIHDLTMHRFTGKHSTTKDYFTYFVWRIGYHIAFLKAVYSSNRIIVPSRAVKDDILNTYKINPNKIIVTHEGIDENFSKDTNKKIYKKYNLPKNYFLYVGSAYPHKNINVAIKAIKELNQSSNQNYYLAIASSRSEFVERIINSAKKEGAEEYIKFLGFVPDEELNSLYKNSLGFVYPTLSEGFGLPGLEAMQAGTLVLTSKIPVLKEIYGENALYFNPKSTTSVKQTMQKVIDMKLMERNKRIKKSREFIKKYSWGKMAEETVEVYTETLK